jgi:hypothetical protein
MKFSNGDVRTKIGYLTKPILTWYRCVTYCC